MKLIVKPLQKSGFFCWLNAFLSVNSLISIALQTHVQSIYCGQISLIGKQVGSMIVFRQN